MPKNKTIKIFSLFLAAFFLFAPCLAFAFEIQYPPVFGLTINDTSTLPEYLRYLFTVAISLATTLATGALIFGGIYYIASFSAGKFTNEGKEWIKAGILGLFLILGSYLIVYTINPDLTIFRMNGLKPVIFAPPLPGGYESNIPKVIYDEIPIGILTENVLSKTSDCYFFDANGDPVPSPLKSESNGIVPGPTLIGADRADCILNLAKASAVKSESIKKFADEISAKMKTCSCEGKCGSSCSASPENACPQNPADENSCKSGACQGKACKALPRSSGDCCDDQTKKDIEEMLGQFRGLKDNLSDFLEKEVQFEGRTVKIIDIQKWKNLKTAEQLAYIKEKTDYFAGKIKEDVNQLTKAKNQLNACYTAMPYVEFLNLYEKTKPEEKLILRNQTYQDFEKNDKISISKYCSGFSYGNSSCFDTCQNICPGNLTDIFNCYKEVPICNPADFKNNISLAICKAGQKQKAEQCFFQRSCLSNSNFGNFEACLSYCRGSCSSACAPEDQECKKKCEENSKCLQENVSSCVLSPPKISQCLKKFNNVFYLQGCQDNAYTCKYGSEQNAGYPECLKNQSKAGEYSASSIFLHPERLLCAPGDYECQQKNPETQKCPDSSYCPNCPCGKSSEQNTVVASKCAKYSFNDDPLTFYCEQNWWQSSYAKTESEKKEPVGEKRYCTKANEIPLGRSADDAEKWGNKILEYTEKLSQNAGALLSYLKKIGQEQNYCKCNSTCEQGHPCESKCTYIPESTSGEVTTPASCRFDVCQGISCQKMINLIDGGKTETCPVEQKGIGYYNDEITKSLKDISTFLFSESGSDIFKELTYSRNLTNLCSLESESYGEKIKLFPCERVQDELVPPELKSTSAGKTVDSYCYGKFLGKYFTKENLTDNWFCCEVYNTK